MEDRRGAPTDALAQFALFYAFDPPALAMRPHGQRLLLRVPEVNRKLSDQLRALVFSPIQNPLSGGAQLGTSERFVSGHSLADGDLVLRDGSRHEPIPYPKKAAGSCCNRCGEQTQRPSGTQSTSSAWHPAPTTALGLIGNSLNVFRPEATSPTCEARLGRTNEQADANERRISNVALCSANS